MRKKKTRKEKRERERKISAFQVKVRALEKGRSGDSRRYWPRHEAQFFAFRWNDWEREERKRERERGGEGGSEGRRRGCKEGKVKGMAGGEWGACGGYHAMRHVRVTSRGRSREHRVLPITCPVTRSPFHPSLSDLSDSVSLSLSLSSHCGHFVGRWVLLSRISTRLLYSFRARICMHIRTRSRENWLRSNISLPFFLFFAIIPRWHCDCLLIPDIRLYPFLRFIFWHWEFI